MTSDSTSASASPSTSPSITAYIAKNLRLNVLFCVLDGSFFGGALGFASFVTIIPLFVNTLTNSAILIGLIPALHTIGWQLPQLLTARSVSRLERYKPMALLMTINERVPFLGLAVLAYFSQVLNPTVALVIAFLMLAWQGVGGGLTATAWQSMIAKIIPGRHRGKFFGLQSAAANLLASISAVIAGIVLVQISAPANFALCFFIASVSMGISFFFLALVREPKHTVNTATQNSSPILQQAGHVLKQDRNFSWFIVARIFSQFATTGIAFYTVYAVRTFNMTAETAGIMTSILLVTQVIANPIMGGLGDKFGHRAMLVFGTFAALCSAVLAWLAGTIELFYIVFALAGIAGVALWTTVMAMTLDFGTDTDRPVYVGLANTVAAPAAIVAPIIGGWIADTFSFGMTFLFSAVCAALTIAILYFCVRDVHGTRQRVPTAPQG